MFVKVCKTTDVSEGSMDKFDVGETSILIARIGDSFFASESQCTHEEADLSLGILSATVLTCPLHQAKFELSSGEVLEGPNSSDADSIRRLTIYPVKVEDGEILVDLEKRSTQ